jgi:hypothetical protein
MVARFGSSPCSIRGQFNRVAPDGNGNVTSRARPVLNGLWRVTKLYDFPVKPGGGPGYNQSLPHASLPRATP